MSKFIELSIGGMWEEKEWRIFYDEEMRANTMAERSLRCYHCSDVHTRIVPATKYKKKHIEYYFICPHVVVAVNEGGHDSTGVCLDCILDAAKENDLL